MKTNMHTPNASGLVSNQDAAAPKTNGPRIGTDDGISNRTLNLLILLFMLLTVSVAVASGSQADELKSRILLRQSMLDIDQLQYDLAIPKLMEVLAKDPSNANAAYLLGVCHLYGTRNFHQAAFYLENASKSVSTTYESWDLDERNAPVQTFYLVATAWEQANDDLRAVVAYENYMRYLTGSDTKKLSPRIMNMVRQNIANTRLRSYESEMLECATALH
jgi:tetratricopeptide (TPR) repeat protein